MESNALTVDGVPVDSYLTRYLIFLFTSFDFCMVVIEFGKERNFCSLASRFVWDEAKYPTMSPLKEVVDNIQSQVAKIEDDLKVFKLKLYFYYYSIKGA